MLLPAGLLVVDPDGRIRSANVTAERMLGFAHGELAGHEAGRVLETRRSRVAWSRRESAPASRSSVILVRERAQAGSAPVAALAAPSHAELDAGSVGCLETELQLVAGLAGAALADPVPAREDLERIARASARAALFCREASATGKVAVLGEIDLDRFIVGFETRLRALLEPDTGIAARTGSAASRQIVSADAELLELSLGSLILRALARVPGPRLVSMAVSPGGRLEVSIGGPGMPAWRRVLGERKLPRAAAWLASQGAMLEEDEAMGGAGQRFRIHLTPVPARGARVLA